MDALVTEIPREEANGAVPEDKGSPDNSEYDSADADSYSDNDTNTKQRSRGSDNDENSNSDDGSFILEREEGDGQESIPNKKVDDDEDKKNPQYIPKRGTFYEHDDRTLEDTEEKEEVELMEKDKDGKKKVWQDKKEQWTHDRFNEPEQAPKSRSELIAIYGYDIRNEEGPPRARRRRKYGRGPNKYTRNWEDEDAYSKPPATTPKKSGKKPIPSQTLEEFPPLINNSASDQNYENKDLIKDEQQQQQVKRVDIRHDQPKERTDSQSSRFENSSNNVGYEEHYKNNQRIGSGRINNVKKEPNESEYHGFTTKSRKVRNRKITSQKVLPANRKDDFIQSQNFSNRNNQDLEKEMSKLNIDDGSRSNSNKNISNTAQQRQSSVPPRLQSEQKGSKRYSSMRQKSLPERNTPPLTNYQHNPTFYPNEYNQQSVPSSAQPLLHQNPQMLSSTTQVAHVAPLQPTPLPQVPVTAAPLLQAATFAPQPYPPPPTAFIQSAAVAGPPFMPAPQPAQLINFVPSQPTFQPNYPGYQQPFNAVTQPAELYQPQGGITYYSTDQQLAQRHVPLKRPKAAIPIVAPPSYDKKDEYICNQMDNSQMENNETLELQQ